MRVVLLTFLLLTLGCDKDSCTDPASTNPEGKAARRDQSRITVISVPPTKPVKDGQSGLTAVDYQRLANVETVVRAVPQRIFEQKLACKNRRYDGRVVATTSDYPQVRDVKIASGRFLSDEDNQRVSNHVVLGARVAKMLFPNEDPLGKTITTGLGPLLSFRVIGVTKPCPAGNNNPLAATDDDVYLPLETVNARFGPRIFIMEAGRRRAENVALHQIDVLVVDPTKVATTAEELRKLLSTRTRRKAKDWELITPSQN